MKHILELSDFQFTNTKSEIASQIGQGINKKLYIGSDITKDSVKSYFKVTRFDSTEYIGTDLNKALETYNNI